MDITFITSNKAKAEQLSRHLNYPITHATLDLPEIQSLDLQTVVTQKAKQAYEILKKPVLVEDTSLVFHCLGDLPGPLIKWFLTSLGNKGLAQLVHKYADVSATAQVLFALYDGGVMQFFAGEVKGSIAKIPRGEAGFGWDPVFIPQGFEKTWGEMTTAEQAQISMRKIALTKLEKYLKQ